MRNDQRIQDNLGQKYSFAVCSATHMTNVILGKEEELATNTETERKNAEYPGNYVFKLAGLEYVHTFSMKLFGSKIIF